MNIERFWSKVEKSDGCWEWAAARNASGYGCLHCDGVFYLAHRLSYLLAAGSLPEDLLVLHHCDNRACVRPDHLFLGTHADNAHDRDSKGRRKAPRGEAHKRSRLTRAFVDEMRERYAAGGVTMERLATEYGVAISTICEVVNHKAWK